MPTKPQNLPHDQIIRDETGAQKLLGYVLDISNADGRARCQLEVNETHLNRHKVLHGGISSCLLDNAAGATASLSVDKTGRTPFLTVSFTVNYIAAVKSGLVEAIGEITGGGSRTLHIASELRDADGTLIATSSGIYQRVPKEKL